MSEEVQPKTITPGGRSWTTCYWELGEKAG
jgi:hypothetical protein